MARLLSNRGTQRFERELQGAHMVTDGNLTEYATGGLMRIMGFAKKIVGNCSNTAVLRGCFAGSVNTRQAHMTLPSGPHTVMCSLNGKSFGCCCSALSFYTFWPGFDMEAGFSIFYLCIIMANITRNSASSSSKSTPLLSIALTPPNL